MNRFLLRDREIELNNLRAQAKGQIPASPTHFPARGGAPAPPCASVDPPLKNGNTCLLLNPFKGEILMLPTTSDVLQVSANTISRQDSYGMGFDNKTNTYKIVRISYHHKYRKGQLSELTAEVLVLGTSSWQELPVVPPCYVINKSASTHGDMHWLVNGDTKDLSSSSIRILSFDFKKKEFYWTPHPAALEKKPSL
ncbi:unnamed protein product [Prunus armeniaca]